MATDSQSPTAAVAAALRRGIETRDAELLASLYAEDCEHVSINRNAPPGRPGLLRGRDAVAAMWREDCAREMTHRVESEVIGDGSFALRVRCRHADGSLVASAVFVELEGALIRREWGIDVWDE